MVFGFKNVLNDAEKLIYAGDSNAAFKILEEKRQAVSKELNAITELKNHMVAVEESLYRAQRAINGKSLTTDTTEMLKIAVGRIKSAEKSYGILAKYFEQLEK
jgi:hypothetical protein